MQGILDEGLDELAVSAHAGFWPRIGVTLAVAGVFAFMLPWRICLGWVCLTLALELQAWFATRNQFLRRPVGWRTRLWHVSGLAAANVAWFAIGAMLWLSGSMEGAVSAILVWLSVIFFAQTNAYQSPLGFVVGGALPSAAVLAVVLLGPNPLHLRMFPVAATLVLALSFAGEGVARMLAARRRLNETQAKMRQSEALYRVLADNVTDVIAMAGLDGQRHYISPSIQEALGYSPEELYRTPSFAYIHPDDREALQRGVGKLAQRGGQLTLEYRVIRADGSPIWVETSFTVAPPTPETAVPQIVSVSRNIERRKELEAQLIEAREAAEAAAAAKSDFLANMTHELRTPLNAIIGFAGILKESPNLHGQDARHARLIRDASGTLLDLVNSVLDFSRLEAGAVELDPAPFDPDAEIRSIVELLEDQARAKGLTLSVRTEGAGLLNGDAKRLRQVVLNFLSNAIKFTAKGAVGVTLAQRPASAGSARLRVEVVDSGVGLPASQIAHIFERFTQADVSVSRQYGGTGLGLAICKRIIELMGGDIGAHSVESEGSTFWFEVELPTAEALTVQEEASARAELARPVRLLLVEDVAINRELVRTVLAPFDIEIETAEDGVQAVEAFRTGSYDLVLMDVQMPVMDGLTAARRIRALASPAAATTPIVAMTANVLPGQIAKCIDAGMDDHLGKPMNPARLLDVIAYWTSHPRETETQGVASASAAG
ncbi:MAG: ATP-binding protein [Caulobacterales bacterium]